MTSPPGLQFVVRPDGSIDVFEDTDLAVTIPRDTLPLLLLDAVRALTQPVNRNARAA
ncbi:MAG: hypothetical protein LJE61_15015 [Thiocapsa sp.]|jgi:hypothetical protein|nr:hypothetical protein [Thiocapsa sp.]MCG6986499.1 hypothetical protein [Thiocapsa sp.]